jgi:aspartate-semialdehyde dehydrogenase
LDKLRVAIVGATGIVGEQFIVALQDHPWFEIAQLAASPRSAGKPYKEALRDPATSSLRWYCKEAPSDEVLNIEVEDAAKLDPKEIDLIFSAVGSSVARELEPRFAAEVPVLSTASAYRYEEDIPVMLPGVNFEHTALIETQQKKRGWKGFIAPQPNCTTVGLVTSLKPILDRFGIARVIMTSLQAVSGAGRIGGVLALDILDNVIPYISKEEEAVERETLKILGTAVDDRIVPCDFKISATCTRVPVLDGHTEAVYVSTEQPCSVEEVKEVFNNFGSAVVKMDLPSAPEKMIVVHEDPFRPQPRLDRDNYNGMALTIGRIRKDNALENGIKYVLLSHNTKMGAAKGSVLIAELLVSRGIIQR